MTRIHALETAPAPKHSSERTTAINRMRTFFQSPIGLASFAVASLVPTLSFSLDPRWRGVGLALLLPVVLVPLILAGFIVGSIASSVRELRELVRDRRTRVIHGIEHATVVMLIRDGYQVRGGQTHDGYFKLWLESDRREGEEGEAEKRPIDVVRRACNEAIEKLPTEGWSLAIHPKCGTTWMVLFLLASLGAMASVAIGLFATLEPKMFLTAIGVFFGALALGSRPIGYLLQRTMTIAVDFKRVDVKRIIRCVEPRDVVCYYVHLEVELDGVGVARA